MTKHPTKLFIRPTTARPDFRLVIAFLWGEANVDTDGDSSSPASTDWKELYCCNRDMPDQVVDVSDLNSSPMTLCIESLQSELAYRMAWFLAKESVSLVGLSPAGPWEQPETFGTEIGNFDLTSAEQRVKDKKTQLLKNQST